MRNKIFLSLFVILLSFGTVFPLLRNGFFQVHDDTSVVRVFEMSKSLTDGMFPVRWVQDLGYGYGYPIFNFYAPLPYYLGSILNLAGFDLLSSTKLMIAIGVLTSAVTMFFFSKRYFGNLGGILSAVAYVYFPYHAVNIYVRGAIGEFFAYAFLPLVFYGFFSILEIKKFKEIILRTEIILSLSLGIFLVAVSHNLSLLMLMIILAPAILFGLFAAKSKITLLTSSIVLISLGILLSSFYVIPAFLEMGFTNVSSQIGGGANFNDHYVCVSQIWQSQWGFGGSIPGCVDGLSFAFGKINLFLLTLAFAFLIYRIIKRKIEKTEKIVVICLLLFLISVFFMTGYSRPVWESISYMAYIQYPWRFINFSALFFSFITGYCVYFLDKHRKTFVFPFVCLALLILLLTSVKYFQPQTYNDHDSTYYKDPDYIKFTVSKISDEYLPPEFVKPVSLTLIPDQRFAVKNGDGVVSTVLDNTNSKKASYAFEGSGQIHINTAYFPAWKAYVNGNSVKIDQVKNGMDLRVPGGSGELMLNFEQTLTEVLGNTISVVSFFALLAVIIISKTYAKKTS